MIESVKIAGYASYCKEPVVLSGLKERNYFFGSNGTGKSSIGKVIADDTVAEACEVVWKNNQQVRTMVYNLDFIEENFGTSGNDLKGVFTLGEDAKETKERIAEAKRELADVGRALLNQKAALDAKDEELEQLESAFTEDCWEQKQKHDEDFADAFKGLRNSREKFRGRVLDELKNSSQLLTLTELQEQAKTVFGDEPEKADVLVLPDASTLLECEGDELLTTKIVGKEDVDIAEIVNRLGNSDWVAAGREYLAESDGLCPFCQQQVPHNLEQELNDYFDETFLQKTRELDEFVRRYDSAVTTLLDELDTVLESDNEFLETRLSELKAHRESLKNLTAGNRQLLERKRQKPSEVVEMASLADESDKMLALIGEVNEKTKQHNTTVDNYQAEKNDLTDKVWKYLIEVELKRTLTKYSSDKKSIQQSIQGIQKKIDATTVARNGLVEEIESLETKTTSVEPTKDAINSLLTNLGFRGFSLEVASDGESYMLLREDGTRVQNTLSEGERSFVTFLYFYYLLKGNHQQSKTNEDTVVVFDDPVSSLDSDILFIVSTLVRRLCEEAGKRTGIIKQVFVMTHNVYFHKEVTFRSWKLGGQETFWLVQKPDATSRVQLHEKNPVQTSYRFMWDELQRNSDNARVIQNTMRRILEHYFKTLGELGWDDLTDKLPEADHLTARSLLAWVHDGSHSAEEDLFICTDGCAETFLRVFRDIFVKNGHESHYLMMCSDEMKEKYAADKAEAAATDSGLVKKA